MLIDINSVIDGFNDTMLAHKEGQNVFDIEHGPLFPSLTSQAKWKYAKNPGGELHLSDGNNVYSFKMPEEEPSEGDFHIERIPSKSQADLGKGATKTGLAQVHRADPGSIYFTIQEGSKNPTYTFKHVGGSQWKAMPKRKKVKAVKQVEVPHVEEFKHEIKEAMEKYANNFLHNLNVGAGHGLLRAMDAGPDLLSGMSNHIPESALIGLGLGGAYDLGKRTLYNTPEENEQETGTQRMIRWLGPAAALGGSAAFYKSLFPTTNAHPFSNPPATTVSNG